MLQFHYLCSVTKPVEIQPKSGIASNFFFPWVLQAFCEKKSEKSKTSIFFPHRMLYIAFAWKIYCRRPKRYIFNNQLSKIQEEHCTLYIISYLYINRTIGMLKPYKAWKGRLQTIKQNWMFLALRLVETYNFIFMANLFEFLIT